MLRLASWVSAFAPFFALLQQWAESAE
jgi:hypothetical protein